MFYIVLLQVCLCFIDRFNYCIAHNTMQQEELGNRWKRKLIVKWKGSDETIKFDNTHDKMGEIIIQARSYFEEESYKHSGVMKETLKKIIVKNWNMVNISIVGYHDNLLKVEDVNIQAMPKFFWSGNQPLNDKANEILQNYRQVTDNSVATFNVEERNDLQARLIKLIDYASKLQYGIVSKEIVKCIDNINFYNEDIEKYKTIASIEKYDVVVLEILEEIYSIFNQFRNMQEEIWGRLECINLNNIEKKAHLHNAQRLGKSVEQIGEIIRQIEGVRDQNLKRKPHEIYNNLSWPKVSVSLMILENLRQIINKTKLVLGKLTKIQGGVSQFNLIYNRIGESFGLIGNRINFLMPASGVSENYPDINKYISKLEKKRKKNLKSLLDSEQWTRWWLYYNVHNIYDYIQSILERKQEDFGDYTLMVIHLGNYYDMCRRCTITWGLESFLGNNHEEDNENTDEFSFCRKFNKIKSQNGKPKMKFLILGSSMASSKEELKEGNIRRYLQGHDGYGNEPIEIPAFLPLTAFKMPEAPLVDALPKYKDTQAIDQIQTNYWPIKLAETSAK